jgi:catechol 2,3-dioxygenase-like lactoylglutathione lyase family enzyme
MAQTNQATRITDVRTVGIPVVDQDRALTFYVGTLGFEKRLDVPMGPGRRWLEVAPPGSSTTIALVASDDESPAGVKTGVRLTTENAETDHATLLSRGVEADEILRWDGVPPMFSFRDQDGNGLVLVEQG